MRRHSAILLLLCSFGSGCQSFSQESFPPGWGYATYDGLLGAIEDHLDSCPQRAEVLRKAYVGHSAAAVKKHLEGQGFDWSPFQPASVVVHDFLTRSPSTGIAWCAKEREIKDSPAYEEMILVQYENGIVTQVVVICCRDDPPPAKPSDGSLD
jgi:hypothetical protein